MSYKRWGRHNDEDVAVEAILDAAGRAFEEIGVAKASMVDVARYAGCSRATLYRYFPNRGELHIAFVQRATLRIAAQMGTARGEPESEPAAELADRIMAGIRAVREDPQLAAWWQPANVRVPLWVSQESDVLRAGAAAAIHQLRPGLANDEAERRGAWMLRTIVAFLALPERDEATEREAIEAFVVPVLLAEAPTSAGSDEPHTPTTAIPGTATPTTATQRGSQQ